MPHSISWANLHPSKNRTKGEVAKLTLHLGCICIIFSCWMEHSKWTLYSSSTKHSQGSITSWIIVWRIFQYFFLSCVNTWGGYGHLFIELCRSSFSSSATVMGSKTESDSTCSTSCSPTSECTNIGTKNIASTKYIRLMSDVWSAHKY